METMKDSIYLLTNIVCKYKCTRGLKKGILGKQEQGHGLGL